ncbi:hypothetical protein [Croceicoccus naphthovorans]|uniref:Uncharacterized protein n=1 Tax=Croceicoccus naphthovorans TaxID=1348774 RepID=A0A0G3XF72_9SPHN|nr:hypothetical protein [Croceicoccus naphthovorans]AKM09857.1 hypothetical protein AB433_07460 [Croceicoccus naphthovorans]MBB3991309.1 hypothetical protein [Croceicoccus naphthovorans]
MTTDRTVRLSPEEKALKLATADAVRAAGGQVFVGEEVGRTQSVISDYGSTSTRSFMPLDIVRKVEALSAGAPGAPHITRALARAQGLSLDCHADPRSDDFDLGDWMARLAAESADVMAQMAGHNLSATCAAMSDNARADMCRELDQLEDVVRQCRAAMERDDPDSS